MTLHESSLNILEALCVRWFVRGSIRQTEVTRYSNGMMIRAWYKRGVALGLAGLLMVSCTGIPPRLSDGLEQVQVLLNDRMGLDIPLGHDDSLSRSTRSDSPTKPPADDQTLTLESALSLALTHNRHLLAQFEELGIAAADVEQAGRLANPVFLAGARFPDRPPSATGLEFELAADFLDLLLLSTRQRMATAQYEQVHTTVTDEVLKLVDRVQRAYFTAVAARQVAVIRGMITDASDASAQLAQRMYEAGNLSDLQLAQEQAAHAATQADLTMARSEAQDAMARLESLLGTTPHGGVDGSLPSQLPDLPAHGHEPTAQQLEQLALQDRLDLQHAQQEAAVVADALELKRDWYWLTDVEVGVGAERDTDRQWVVGPSVSLQVPLFDQGQADVARLESQLRQARHHIAAIEWDTRTSVRRLHRSLRAVRQRIDQYRRSLIPLRERVVKLMQEEQNFMLIGVFEVLAAKQQEYDTYVAYVEAVRDYWLTRSRLQYAVGGRLDLSAAVALPSTGPGTTTKKMMDSTVNRPEHKHHHGSH